jgi:hypothetical protein
VSTQVFEEPSDLSQFVDFPNNVVLALAQSYLTLPGVELVCLRPLRPSDPNVSVGVIAMDWEPIDAEIGRSPDPTVGRYNFAIMCSIRHAVESDGLAAHAYLSKRVRAMVYRDNPTRVRLLQLRVDGSDGIKERAQRLGIRRQRFMSNEARGNFMYLSTMEFWLETETN